MPKIQTWKQRIINCKHVFLKYSHVIQICRMPKSTFLNVGLFYCNLYICISSMLICINCKARYM